MKRKIYKELLDWKNNISQSLLVKGARQVGKTFIVKEFGKSEFKNVLYLNFEDQLDMKQAFDAMPNPSEAVKTLQAYGISQNIFNIEGKETLIFLDEIQLSKRAYSLLKPLTEMKKYKIVASGSMLGISLNGDFLDPGPAIKHIEMYPMDFEEFLWAVHGEEINHIIDSIKIDAQQGKPINQTLHHTLNSDIKDYVIVGGMPQVVLEFINTKDLGKVFLKQEGIVTLYRSDIQQYQSTQDNKIKTLKCFDSIPNQFSRDNHRFMYNAVEENKTARHFGNAIDWLERTGNTRKCYHIDHLRGSLVDGKGSLFKLYMNDIGLLVSMLGQDYIYKIQNDALDLFKGALYEQLLAQMLVVKKMSLYYVRIGDYEIDFLVEHHGKILPIECKSGGNTKSKSLKSYIDKFKPNKAFKVSLNNMNVSDKTMKAIPHYIFALLTIQELAAL
ncbi:MAG: ATP-binding protein [Candidatus Izemoplasmataceae bacterium]